MSVDAFSPHAVSMWRELMKMFGVPVLAKQRGGAVTTKIGFTRPESQRFDGSVLATEYEIEYLTSDIPLLALNDQVTFLEADLVTPIPKAKYRVREAPSNSDLGADGTFMRAKLTKL